MLLTGGSFALTVLAATNKSSPIATLFPLFLIILVGYFFLVRPARARQREVASVRSRLEPGAEVQTTAGLLATVTEVGDDGTVILEVAPGVRCRYLAAAVARVIPPEVPETSVSDADTPESGETPRT